MDDAPLHLVDPQGLAAARRRHPSRQRRAILEVMVEALMAEWTDGDITQVTCTVEGSWLGWDGEAWSDDQEWLLSTMVAMGEAELAALAWEGYRVVEAED